MRGIALFLALLAVGPAVVFAQNGADHIGLYLDAQATNCTAVLDGPGQLVQVKVLAVLPELAAPIIAAEFCLQNLPPTGGEGQGMWVADWGAALVIGDPRYALALAWTTPQPGPIVELGTITFYSLGATDWIGPDHLIGVRETITYDTPVSVVTADGATVLVGGASFVFNCSDPELCPCWVDAAPVCEISATALDFGELFIGDIAEQSITISNPGHRPLAGLVSLDNTANFTIETGGGPFVLGVGLSREVEIRFVPMQEGPAQAVLSLGTALCPEISCTGSAVPRVPVCEIEYEFTDFGTVAVGDFRTLVITLHNSGTGTVHLGIPSGENGFVISQFQTGYHSLPPGSNFALRVDFQPMAVGPASWTLDFGSEYCAQLDLTGNGRESNAICELEPPALDFAGVEVGEWLERRFTIRNLGTDRFVVRALHWCGDFTLNDTSFGWIVLDPGTASTLTVRFRPEELGPTSCEFDLRCVPCASLPVSGIGVDALSCLVAPHFLDFGSVGLGAASVRSFTVTNESDVPFWCEIPELDGQFVTLAGAGPALLAVGEPHAVQVSFAPTSVGQHRASIDLGDSPCATVQLQGTGREPIMACALEPDGLDFGSVGIGALAERSFTIANEGDFGFACDVPEASAPFATVAGAGHHELAPRDEIEVRVRFTPETLGPASAELSLGAGPCATIPLVGSGREPIISCSVSPSLVDFGDVPLEASGTRSVYLRNTGDLPIDGEGVIEGAGFAIDTGGGPFTLAAGALRILHVSFLPPSHGLHGGTISFGETPCSPTELVGFGRHSAPDGNRIGLFADAEGTICDMDAIVGQPLELRILAVVPDFGAEGLTGAEFRIAGLSGLAGLATWSFTWTWPPVEGDPESGIRFEFPPVTGGLVEIGRLQLSFLQNLPPHQTLLIERSNAGRERSIRDHLGEGWDLNTNFFVLNCEQEWFCECIEVNTPVVLSDFSVESQGDRAILRWTTGEALDAEFRLVGAAQGSEWELAYAQEANGSYRAEDTRWGELGGIVIHYQLYGRLPGEDWQLLREASLASPAVVGPARLLAPHPNPFNPSVTIPFRLPAPQRVRLLLHDVAGRRVALLADREFPAGEHALLWDGRDEAGHPAGSGVYFVRLEAAGVSESQKLVLLR
jgi:hypothetical protein